MTNPQAPQTYADVVQELATVFDGWCAKKLGQISPILHKHVWAGKDLNSPHYRRLLGEADAYMKMRSFIHGCRPHRKHPRCIRAKREKCCEKAMDRYRMATTVCDLPNIPERWPQ